MAKSTISHPALDDERLAMLLAELTDAVQRGEPVDFEGVCREHPDLAGELRQLWGAVLVADAAASHPCAAGEAEDAEGAELSLQLPCRFGSYELIEEIGRGGMGIVYRARQLNLDREVAVKMILRGPLASGADRQRFHVEAEAAARLDHANIVPVYEVGDAQGRPYFSMKYIIGRTLSSLLADQPLAPREAARILADVSRAIDYAHRRGVLHRDLKPSNVLIDEHGRPHVTDFGLAKQTSDETNITQTGAVLGTPSYMAPEQAAGDRGEVGPASDVYSLGAILYHMQTGRPPFQAASPVDTVLLVLEQDPVPPRMLNPKADRDLEMIALRSDYSRNCLRST
jgi:serine/threonine protein kinase